MTETPQGEGPSEGDRPQPSEPTAEGRPMGGLRGDIPIYQFREAKEGEAYDMAHAERVARLFLIGFIIFGAIFGALLWVLLPR